MAGAIAAFGVLFAAAGSAHPTAVTAAPKPVVEAKTPCCVQIVQAQPAGYSSSSGGAQLFSAVAPSQMTTASRWRIIDVPRLLPRGIAPERGLQVKTILVARSISQVFPEIHEIGGVRSDALRWHPDGLALDVMIPDPGSSEGIRIGNEIVAYALKNAARFGLQDAIWRGVYYTPGGAESSGSQSSGYGHFDHVHITTLGGGYPTGSELYYR